jgi:hypothetical protein
VTNSSCKPHHSAGELDEAGEVGGEYVVSRCDTTPLFELGKEALVAPSPQLSLRHLYRDYSEISPSS